MNNTLLIETPGATVGDQTAIIRNRHKMEAIRKIFDARIIMGKGPEPKLFDYLMDLKNYALISVSKHYATELDNYIYCLETKKQYDFQDVEY